MSRNKFIDVEDLIRSKNPKLLKWLPKFILSFIKRTIHQDQVNQILEDNKSFTGLDFVHNVVHNDFKIRAEIHGVENLPDDGQFILAANHPWGALEALTLLDIVGQKFKEPRFIVNDLLMYVKNFHPLFLPVNKHGAQARSHAQLLDENYRSNRPILVFPSGLVSRRKRGKVRDLDWKANFIGKAIQYKRNVVPVFIDGHNSNFFYRIAHWRQAIGLKANIEMFYLVDEMMKNRDKTLPFYFGKAIPYTVFDKSKSRQEWALLVQNYCYNLNNKQYSFQDYLLNRK